jgi:hypothetical protein
MVTLRYLAELCIARHLMGCYVAMLVSPHTDTPFLTTIISPKPKLSNSHRKFRISFALSKMEQFMKGL